MIENPHTLAEGQPDPATPGRRRELARAMLAEAIDRFEEAERRWQSVYASFPNLPGPRVPVDQEENAERRDWRRLLRAADEAFHSAECGLAVAIQNLYDHVAPEGRRSTDHADDEFASRAVRRGGWVYVLDRDASQYDPETTVLVSYRASMTVDLDAAPGRPDADIE